MNKVMQTLDEAIKETLLLIGDISGKAASIQQTRQAPTSSDTRAGDIVQLCTLLEELKAAMSKADAALLSLAMEGTCEM